MFTFQQRGILRPHGAFVGPRAVKFNMATDREIEGSRILGLGSSAGENLLNNCAADKKMSLKLTELSP